MEGKIEFNGVKFHRDIWDETPEPINPFTGLNYIKKKHEMGQLFGKYFMNHRLPNDKLNYEEENKLKNEFIESVGFTEKELNSWPYNGWTHKLKVDDLKDLLRTTFEKDLKEDLAEYHTLSEELNQYNEDWKNREVFFRQIEDFIAFRNMFKVRKTSFNELIEGVELSIGKGHYRRLAYRCESYNRFEFVPEEAKINSFEAMAYAKEWIRTFDPVISELNRLEDALKMPYELKGLVSEIPDKVKRTLWLSDVVKFRYQDFLTFLMDFKKRFGYDDGCYNRDAKHVTGWTICNYDYEGEYCQGGDASKWDVFNTQKDRYGRQGSTWGKWLVNLALNGRIEAICDPDRLSDIVNRTNPKRHKHNKEYKLYEKPIVLCTRVEPKKEDEE